MSVKTILDGLSSRQRQAVETTRGPSLVLAGPGSGKTRVVTRRIAYLLEKGVSPESILAVTFTRKAAEEMNTRVSELLGGLPSGLTICTFHSLGNRLLRENLRVAGLQKPHHIISEEEQKYVAEQLLAELSKDMAAKKKKDGDAPPYLAPRDLLTKISLAKNWGQSPADVKKLAENDGEHYLAEAYARYEVKLQERNAVDLDDLILRSLRDVLERDSAVADAYQRQWRYIMVDEFQDVNSPQFELTNMLVSSKRNICVVGDDDQSIYGFRGSQVDHILNFADSYPGTRLIKLEVNYRSPSQIVDMSSNVIQASRERYPKKLTSHMGQGADVRWTVCSDEADEADEVDEIVKAIRTLVDSEKRDAPYTYDDMMVLTRVHDDARRIKFNLLHAGIPVVRRGQNSGVRLSTIHGSKGLEFPVVFMPTLEDGNVPHANAVNNGDAAVEEERRLFYVGLTRAQDRLFLSNSRTRNGQDKMATRFLYEQGQSTPKWLDMRVPRSEVVEEMLYAEGREKNREKNNAADEDRYKAKPWAN